MLVTEARTEAVGDLFGDEAFWEELRVLVLEEMGPVFRALLEAGAEAVVAEKALKVDASMSTVDVLLANVVPEYSDDWWNRVATTTQQGLRKAISGAIETGEPVDKVIKDITPLFGPVRAERIAVTETTRLFAKGAEASYQAAGVERVLWRTVKDTQVCPTCRGYAENKEGWPLGTGPKPPAHVGCRCFLSPMTEEEYGEVLTEEAEPERRPKGRASRGDTSVSEARRVKGEHFSRGENVDKLKSRTEAKKKVVKDITKRMSEDKRMLKLFEKEGFKTAERREAWVDRQVKTWSFSSSDSQLDSLCLQKAASVEFGVGKKNINVILKQLSVDNKLDFSDAWERSGGLYKGFVRSMYENTQEQLAVEGIKELSVFRGFAWPRKTAIPSWAKRIKSGDTGRASLNPMSSFSVDEQVARRFAEEEGIEYPLLLQGTVPANRVISTARTGLGCLNEYEVVILDGPGEWEVLKGW